MNSAEILSELRARGVALAPDGDRLRWQAPKGAMTPELVDALRRAKADILAALTAPEPLDEERTAIVEHDAGIPRAWAEGFARLDPDRPPADVPARRWLQFVDDVGRFLDTGWPARAAALGWGPLDLFGCDHDKPFARIDRAGLLWLLDGNRLVALSARAAAIETATGARLTFRLKPNEPGRVLAWELDREKVA